MSPTRLNKSIEKGYNNNRMYDLSGYPKEIVLIFIEILKEILIAIRRQGEDIVLFI